MSANFDFGTNFGRKTRRIVHAVLNRTRSYQLILLIFNSKHGMALGYTVSKFDVIRTKLRPWECRIRKYKMAADDVIKLKYPKSEKKLLAHVLKTDFEKFHRIWPSRLGCRADTDRQTDRRVHRQTPSVHPNIFCHFKWLNIKTISMFAYPGIFKQFLRGKKKLYFSFMIMYQQIRA